MTNQEIDLVRTSFGQILTVAPQAAALFYERLFEVAPNTRMLFKTEAEEQERKFTQMIQMLVDSLDRSDEILAMCRASGRSHQAYGVAVVDYRPVGESLIWAISQALGPQASPETLSAWRQLYVDVGNAMICGAEETT